MTFGEGSADPRAFFARPYLRMILSFSIQSIDRAFDQLGIFRRQLARQTARSVLAQLSEEAFAAGALTRVSPPAAAAVFWPGLCRVIARLRDTNTAWQGQIGLVRDWYQPLLDRLYDYPAARAGDLDQVEQIAFGYTSRERFLTELTLDPPDASGAEAGRPLLDEDYLILSTIHSAKGQEWETVYILNLVDGCIPSDKEDGTTE